MAYTAPTKIESIHETENFDSGQESLNVWLKKRALKNERDGASRTYVVCENNQVVGYYSIAAGSVSRDLAISKAKRNMPDPIPAMILARLAVDINHQGKGLGTALLKDAVLRILQASEIAGIKVILVHALDERAKTFYEKYGFKPSPINELILMVTLKDIKASFLP